MLIIIKFSVNEEITTTNKIGRKKFLNSYLLSKKNKAIKQK